MQNVSTHPHAQALTQFYNHYLKGQYPAALQACAPNASFQVPGRSPIAGKFTAANFADYGVRMHEISGGDHSVEIHDIMASDLHGTVLLTEKIATSTGPVELRIVHVWRFQDGLPLAGYVYPRDLYQYDQVWSRSGSK